MAAWLLLVLAVGVAILAVVVLAGWQGRIRSGGGASLDAVLATHGPARCLAAIRLLSHLATSTSQERLPAVIEALELPLLQALPDCPPAAKPALAEALEACARGTTHRDAAKRLMTLRNALLS